jgi:methylglutaconyl-CoA hydratase
VIGPAVERKIGVAAFSQLAIDATNWQSAAWAEKAGLFTELHGTIEGMDASVEKLSHTLSQYNPDAMAAMKSMLWQGTDHWDKLLYQRAAISGKLAVGSFAKEAIAGFLKK